MLTVQALNTLSTAHKAAYVAMLEGSATPHQRKLADEARDALAEMLNIAALRASAILAGYVAEQAEPSSEVLEELSCESFNHLEEEVEEFIKTGEISHDLLEMTTIISSAEGCHRSVAMAKASAFVH